MSRESFQGTKLIPAHSISIWKKVVKCDGCGKTLDKDLWQLGEDDNMFPNELMILLNQEECVSSKFRRDLCNTCLEPIWLAICNALGADPDDISGSDFSEDED